MIRNLGITEARKEINNLAATLDTEDTVAVTNRGEEVLAILPWRTYEAVTETLEILSDPAASENLRRGIDDYREGRTVDWDEALREIGDL